MEASLSVCVPTVARESLFGLLASLERARAASPVPVEVLLGDASGELSPQPGTRVVDNRQGSAAAGRNACVAQASGELLVFVDDDVELRPDYFACLLAGAREPWQAWAGPIARRPGGDRANRAWAALFDGNFSLPQRHPYVRWAPSANLVLRRGAFDALGFRELGPGVGGEDVDLGLRLEAAGLGPIRSLRGLVVDHVAGTETLARLKEKAHAYGRAEQLLGQLHPGYEDPRARRPLPVGRGPRVELLRAFERGRRSVADPPRPTSLARMANLTTGPAPRLWAEADPAQALPEGAVLLGTRAGERLLYAREALEPSDSAAPVEARGWRGWSAWSVERPPST